MCKELVKIKEFLAKSDFNGFTGDDLFIKNFIKHKNVHVKKNKPEFKSNKN